MSYQAPVSDMRFVLRELTALPELQQIPQFADASDDTIDAVLEEAARFVGNVVAPLNWTSDLHPARWHDGQVTTTPGFQAAFRAYVDGGWQGVQHPVEFGGQGLPKVVATASMEMLQAASLSFALCPLLTDGAIEALLTAASPELRTRYVPRLVDGAWTGTMNLTEPQAGSDLALVRTRAVPQADGSYRITGQKIFITYGDHDLTENIVHMVLARTPDAPPGVKGISLFVVPKFLVEADGSVGARNDVYCASIEHKLGIKGSPTAVLIFGDDRGAVGAGAIGHVVGEENRGLEYMFVMMNAARFQVGIQGVAIADRAYQKAVAFARERVQGRAVEGSPAPVAIIHHPDVRRMLMTMRASTEAARALAYVAGAWCDLAHAHDDEAVRVTARADYEYLVPIIKGWSTEMSIEVASLGVQVHGGMGFIEETGAAQFYRDARILTIYEGTTAIQANDLIGRKTVRDGGAVARRFAARMRDTARDLAAIDDANFKAMAVALANAADDFEASVEYILGTFRVDVRAAFAGSVPYLMLAGYVFGGWQMARAALAAQRQLAAGTSAADFYRAKIGTAQFFMEHLLPRAGALRIEVLTGAGSTLALAEDDF